MVCSAVLKVLNLYVLLFHLSITLLSVLCARVHTLGEEQLPEPGEEFKVIPGLRRTPNAALAATHQDF